MFLFRVLAGIIATGLFFVQFAATVLGLLGLIAGLIQLNSSYGVLYIAGGGVLLILALILNATNKRLARFVRPGMKPQHYDGARFPYPEMSSPPADGFPHRSDPPIFRP